MFAMSADDEMPGAVSKVTRAVFDRISGPKELVEVDGATSGSWSTQASRSTGPVRHRPRG